MASLAVYGWNDNYVLIDHGNGNITIYDCVAEENIAGWHAGMDYVHSIKEALEFIENYEGWDGGGDVNVEGVYYDFGGHDYSHKRNLKIEMGYDQTPYEVGKSTKKSQSVKKDDSEPRYKIEFMYKEYDGEYTAEECGKNVEVMLKDTEPTRLYNPHFTFYRTDAGFKASTKKSQPATKSFNDMVAKQRDKNRIGKDYYEDIKSSHKQAIFDRISDLYHSYFVVDEIIPQESPIKAKCEDVYNAIAELNKALTDAYKEW